MGGRRLCASLQEIGKLKPYDNMRNSEKNLSQAVQRYAKYELLILDEWLMYEMSNQDKQFISKLMEVRHDTCSTIFLSLIHI